MAVPLILVLMALMTLGVHGLWRTATHRELLAQADADLLQTRIAAHALLNEAQRDILDSWPATRHSPGSPDAIQAFFPRSQQEYDALASRLKTNPAAPCQQGICLALPEDGPPWVRWQSRLDLAASPGEFITIGTTTPFPEVATRQPVDPTPGRLYQGRGGYWIEVLPFDMSTAPASVTIDRIPAPAFVYRITALAQGRLSGTRVLQQMLWLRSTTSETSVAEPEPTGGPRVLSWLEWLT